MCLVLRRLDAPENADAIVVSGEWMKVESTLLEVKWGCVVGVSLRWDREGRNVKCK